jgi:phage tail sheath protein FI
MPASHMALRTYIRNDNVSYQWFAPAGVRRGLIDNAADIGWINPVTGGFVRNAINNGLRDALYENRINPFTILPGVGLVCWGQKTRNPVASSMDRVNVARLVNYIRTILANVGNAFLFEPNDKITRDQIKNIIEGAINDLIAKRGIYDYLVVCDETNNTAEVIDTNRFVADIYIKPARSINFITLNFIATRTGVEFSEIVGTGN